MSHLFLVETPFQLMCAYEVIQGCRQPYQLVVRRTGVGEGRNDAQMEAAVQFLGLKVQWIHVRRTHIALDAVRALPKIIGIALRRPESLFIASYFSRFLRLLASAIRAKRKYLLDDGVATFLAQRLMAEGGRLSDLATCFDVSALPGQTVLRHSFARLRESFTVSYVDEALFIGQPLGDIGWDSEDYVAMVANAAAAAGGRVTYIPHRTESAAEIAAVASVSGVEIVRPSMCVELYLLEKVRVPKRIFTYLSTAAFSIAAMHPECQIFLTSPDLPRPEKIPHFKEIVAAARNVPNISVYDPHTFATGIAGCSSARKSASGSAAAPQVED